MLAGDFRDYIEEAVSGNERGVELYEGALVPAQVRGFFFVARFAEVAVPILGVGLLSAAGEHAEQAVAHSRAGDEGFEMGCEILVDPVGEGRVVLIGVEEVTGAAWQTALAVNPAYFALSRKSLSIRRRSLRVAPRCGFE